MLTRAAVRPKANVTHKLSKSRKKSVEKTKLTKPARDGSESSASTVSSKSPEEPIHQNLLMSVFHHETSKIPSTGVRQKQSTMLTNFFDIAQVILLTIEDDVDLHN